MACYLPCRNWVKHGQALQRGLAIDVIRLLVCSASPIARTALLDSSARRAIVKTEAAPRKADVIRMRLRHTPPHPNIPMAGALA